MLDQVFQFLGTVFIGPITITSYSLSLYTKGGIGSEKAKALMARLQKKFLYCSKETSKKYLQISMKTYPQIKAVEVAIAGMIFPALIFIS